MLRSVNDFQNDTYVSTYSSFMEICLGIKKLIGLFKPEITGRQEGGGQILKVKSQLKAFLRNSLRKKPKKEIPEKMQQYDWHE